jgi:GNAT superfamily N-acetyltransferase
MEVLIRKGNAHDVPAMLALIRELAEYEKAPAEVETTEASMLRDGFGGQPLFHSLVAEYNGRLLGLAVFYTAYSTWKGKMIYLDDLIVTQSMRGKGVGKKLFDATVDWAKNCGARQLRWQVLEWNTTAIRFYQHYPTSFDPEWWTCKLSLR